ncbi:MAG: rhomboid family intramembrane serine protease [Marinilabiliaceae bacterium]|nr:rhomboid family intramembrane serine protease [Marinilabiliaceae bacterium]
MSIIDEIKNSFKNGSIVTRLIYINIGVFLLIRLVQLIIVLGGNPANNIRPFVSFFMVPAYFPNLLLKPWSLVTYMFTHYDFIHLLFNILYIFWFGRIFIEIIGSRLLLRVYFLGGLSGALLYLISFNMLPAFKNIYGYSEMLGASAAAIAILFTIARVTPDYKIRLLFFGPVKLKYIALIALILDLISISNMSNTGGHIAHIGGAIFGLIFGKLLIEKKIKYPSKNNQWFNFSQKSKMKIVYSRPLTDMEYNTIKKERQNEIDRILDKIKESGYESLTKEEKNSLFKASKS